MRNNTCFTRLFSCNWDSNWLRALVALLKSEMLINIYFQNCKNTPFWTPRRTSMASFSCFSSGVAITVTMIRYPHTVGQKYFLAMHIIQTPLLSCAKSRKICAYDVFSRWRRRLSLIERESARVRLCVVGSCCKGENIQIKSSVSEFKIFEYHRCKVYLLSCTSDISMDIRKRTQSALIATGRQLGYIINSDKQ